MSSWKTTLVQRDRARADRPELTVAETSLWSALKGSQAGARCRRKAPIGPYIVDFLCQDAKLVIDIEPDTFDDSARPGLARTAFLHAMGFRRICLQTADVLFDFANVCDMIGQAVRQTSDPRFAPVASGIGAELIRVPKRQSARPHDRSAPFPPDHSPRPVAGRA